MSEQIITGTFRILEVGKIYYNEPFSFYEQKTRVTIRVIRESTEEEYRKFHSYKGEIPRGGNYYLIEALD